MRTFAMACIVALAGCAHVPDVTVNYYLARTRVSIKVVRTVACDAANNPVVAYAVTPIPTHEADTGSAIPLSLKALRGSFVDSDLKFEFTDDGRLKTINATSTGQGEAIIKSFVALATTTVAALGKKPAAPATFCTDVKDFGSGKPLTLTYNLDVDLAKQDVEQLIRPDEGSAFYDKTLNPTLGTICVWVNRSAKSSAKPVINSDAAPAKITAQQPGAASLKVARCGVTDESQKIWRGEVPVAHWGTKYDLPIPAGAAFGKQVFAATFADSGALASIQYTSNSASGQAADTLSAIVLSSQGEATAQKLADVKNQADLIAQQQRLVQCLADRTTCK